MSRTELDELLGYVDEAIQTKPLTRPLTEEIDRITSIAYNSLTRSEYATFNREVNKRLDVIIDRKQRSNPSVSPDVRAAAISKFKEFHRYEPTKITDFPDGFAIPTEMVKVGRAKSTTYRSGKVDPATLKRPRAPFDYIHEHDAGVMFYMPVGDEDLDELELEDTSPVMVPRQFAEAEALVKLGDSLGCAFQVDGDCDPWDAESARPLPELYCTTDGKCLLVIQGRREVLAMIWGGALGVYPRGIDG